MGNRSVDVVSVGMSSTPAYHKDNSIINTRNIDTIPPTDIAVHAHPFYNLTYICRCDSFTTYIDNCPVVYTSGYIYLAPPDTLHSPRNQYSGTVSAINAKFYITDKELAENIGFLPMVAQGDNDMRALLKKIADTARSSEHDKLDLLSLQITELLHLLLNSPSLEPIRSEESQYDLRFIKVLKYMYAHCNRDIDLGELAGIAHMERTAFAKKFKSLYNITPINYLYSIRLSRSLDLLMSPEITIAKIAQRVGFKRATAFSAAFLRTFGMTPTVYRKMLETRKFPPKEKEFEI